MTEKLYKAKVSYYETDCMNIVHHSNFIRYFEYQVRAFRHACLL